LSGDPRDPRDPAPADPPPATGERVRSKAASLLENAVADVIRRGVEAGWERLNRGDRAAAMRAAIGDLRVPREIAAYLGTQLDDTKSAIVKVVAREVRQFLETTHFAEEVRRLLTSLTFEITTQVRFVPSDRGDGVRPKVRSQVKVKGRRGAEVEVEKNGEAPTESDDGAG
jgi:hypothetical protein